MTMTAKKPRSNGDSDPKPVAPKPVAPKRKAGIVTFEISREALAAAVRACKRVVGKRSTIPILSHVRIKGEKGEPIHVIANNLDIELACAMPNVAKTTIDLTVPFDLLTRVVKVAKDVEAISVKVETIAKVVPLPVEPKPGSPAAESEANPGKTKREAVYDTKVTLYADDLEIDAEWLPAEDFPSMPEAEKTFAKVSLDAETVWLALQKTEHAISTEETRYYLNGVCFSVKDQSRELNIVATDGHRLAQYETGVVCAEKYGLWETIIPRTVVQLLLDLLEKNAETKKLTFVFAKPAMAHTSVGAFGITFKLIDGTYPDVQRVIPSPEKSKCVVEIEPDALLKALGKLATVSGTKKSAVRLSPKTAGGLTLAKSAGTDDPRKVVRLELPRCTLSGEPIEIGVNTDYLLTVTNLIEGDAIRIGYEDAGAPMRVTDPADPRLTYVLMPMRV